VLVSTAHDEPAIRLDIFKDVFRKPAALCYLTESEREFVHQQFPDRPLLEDVTGVGIEIPPSQPYPRMPPPAEEESSTEGGQSSDPPRPDDASARDLDGPAASRQDTSYPSHLRARGSVFRRRHRMHGPIVLYGGRIDPGKGCEELIQYFSDYVKEGG